MKTLDATRLYNILAPCDIQGAKIDMDTRITVANVLNLLRPIAEEYLKKRETLHETTLTPDIKEAYDKIQRHNLSIGKSGNKLTEGEIEAYAFLVETHKRAITKEIDTLNEEIGNINIKKLKATDIDAIWKVNRHIKAGDAAILIEYLTK